MYGLGNSPLFDLILFFPPSELVSELLGIIFAHFNIIFNATNTLSILGIPSDKYEVFFKRGAFGMY